MSMYQLFQNQHEERVEMTRVEKTYQKVKSMKSFRLSHLESLIHQVEFPESLEEGLAGPR
jgi:hypothetical protein